MSTWLLTSLVSILCVLLALFLKNRFPLSSKERKFMFILKQNKSLLLGVLPDGTVVNRDRSIKLPGFADSLIKLEHIGWVIKNKNRYMLSKKGEARLIFSYLGL